MSKTLHQEILGKIYPFQIGTASTCLNKQIPNTPTGYTLIIQLKLLGCLYIYMFLFLIIQKNPYLPCD